MTPRVLLEGLAIPESPRWHDGRLWFSNWGTRQIVAVDLGRLVWQMVLTPDGPVNGTCRPRGRSR